MNTTEGELLELLVGNTEEYDSEKIKKILPKKTSELENVIKNLAKGNKIPEKTGVKFLDTVMRHWAESKGRKPIHYTLLMHFPSMLEPSDGQAEAHILEDWMQMEIFKPDSVCTIPKFPKYLVNLFVYVGDSLDENLQKNCGNTMYLLLWRADAFSKEHAVSILDNIVNVPKLRIELKACIPGLLQLVDRDRQNAFFKTKTGKDYKKSAQKLSGDADTIHLEGVPQILKSAISSLVSQSKKIGKDHVSETNKLKSELKATKTKLRDANEGLKGSRQVIVEIEGKIERLESSAKGLQQVAHDKDIEIGTLSDTIEKMKRDTGYEKRDLEVQVDGMAEKLRSQNKKILTSPVNALKGIVEKVLNGEGDPDNLRFAFNGLNKAIKAQTGLDSGDIKK